ncbi:hypothetical protein CCR75_001579 [Bremia lactucae]|uniref:Uncharacterized protein n=1 Tax=Bremia lactucae TaxID=4779 RepID=A0A976FHQ3_BRELC|nr:hypothetical protein CCR75_001579 [Bremia lactucae]
MFSRRATPLVACRLTRHYVNKATIQVPVQQNKVHETPIVRKCGGNLMRWVGIGSRYQMYCSLLLSGSLVYQAAPSANILELLATNGAICSASVAVFFGAKRMCDTVVTDITSCRKVGDFNEFVRVTVMGIGVQELLEASPKDFKLLKHDDRDAYSFMLGRRRLQLDISTGKDINRKALNRLMAGKPLITRKIKQSKKDWRK